MLDKAHASYRDAGRALREYAAALGSAQRQSALAARAAAIAQTALNEAKSAHEAAIARDAEAAKAAATAGLPPPMPTAQSLEQDIDDASRRLRQAQQAYEDARDEVEHAARVAAASLHRASREGIRNKPWWRHVLHDAGHWAHSAWVGTLRFVSKVAVTVSAVAGLAALVLSVAGLFFAPLEVAAGALEAVSFAAGSVALASQAALAITGDASWVSVGLDALALLPAVGAKGTRAIAPAIRRVRTFRRIARAIPEPNPIAAPKAVATRTGLWPEDTWANRSKLTRHFRSHGTDFGARSEQEYATMASSFLQNSNGLPTKIGSDGTIRVFDPASNTFGAYSPSGGTRTFFKPSSSTYWKRQPGKLIEDLMKP
jgi:hypothetical protein